MRSIFSTLLFLLTVFNFGAGAQTKKPPITPRWAFGHIVWEDSINTQQAAISLVEGYLRRNIPVSGIIIDSPWSTAYNNFNWNTVRYPDPTGMIAGFSRKNVKTILWLTGCVNLTAKDMPLQKHERYDWVREKGYAINSGQPSEWWKGKGLHIDFTNPEAKAWWYTQLDKVFTDGVWGWKTDQGEIFFGDTVSTSIGRMTNEQFRPYYYDAMFEYATERNTKGGLIIGRPFSHQGGVEADISEVNMGWCGDFTGDWVGLKHQISNICESAELGYGALACEVGGFWGARSSKEEFIRYCQF
jgi:alpha-glucosidase (family GH31 glycosyl hydrolase)